MDSWHMQLLGAVADSEGFSLRKALGDLEPDQLELILYGAGEKKYKFKILKSKHQQAVLYGG